MKSILFIILLGITGLGLGFVEPSTAQVETGSFLAEYTLGEGLRARLDDSGDLVVELSDNGTWTTWLRCHWDDQVSGRPTETTLFTAQAREGDSGGRRGFARQADDDGDGRIDEDPLDGRDNDGDGLVDEDFGAVSHDMAVWDRSQAGRTQHLETYHWSYSHLSGLLAAVYQQHDGTPAPLTMILEDGAWTRADEVCLLDEEIAAGPVYLVPHAASGHWLGLALLDGEPRHRPSERVRTTERQLEIPLLDGHQAVALAVGPTRLRVVNDLVAANQLRQGVEDPVSSQRVPWLPSAVSVSIQADQLPLATLHQQVGDGLTISLEVTAGTIATYDPDLFILGETPLGTAQSLTWKGAQGNVETLAWPPVQGSQEACQPYSSLGATTDGRLEFHFANQEQKWGMAPMILQAVALDGRRAQFQVAEFVEADQGAGESLDLNEQDGHLQLSPDLLNNFPNPFRTQTRVSYRIPANAGEAFRWTGDGEAPFDPQMAMPYAGLAPNVQVTVYSLVGREVASLFTGSQSPGQFEAVWDGRDTQGRLMASGAYFCKLQIENWSVTKRLIFIR